MVQFATLVLGLLAACTPLSFAAPALQERLGNTEVNLRIEGVSNTIWEGKIKTGPRDVTTASGGTHHCEYPTISFQEPIWDNKRSCFTGDGTNNGANPVPGPTCTSALADFSALSLFKWDGTVRFFVETFCCSSSA